MKLKNKILTFAITSLLFLFNLAKAVFANDLSADLSSNDLVSDRSMGLGDEDPRSITANIAYVLIGFSYVMIILTSLYQFVSALIKKSKGKTSKLYLYNVSDTKLSLYMMIFGLLSLPLAISIFFMETTNLFYDHLSSLMIPTVFSFLFGLGIFLQKNLLIFLAKKNKQAT